MHSLMASSLKERTAKGLLWGGAAGGAQQVLALVIGIVLARRLMPADYGMVAMLTVFSLLAGNLEEGGFTSAIAVKKQATNRDYEAVLWFSVAMGVGLYIILWFAAPLIAAFNHTPQLTLIARVQFAGFVVSGFGVAQSAYLFRHLMVKQRAIATSTAVCVGGAAGIAVVVSGGAYWGLVVQDLTYKLVVVVMYWVQSPWRPRMRFDLSPIKEMVGFSCKILATNMLTTLNNQFLQALLGHFFPRHEVGLYSQANKWNTMGYSLVSTTISSVAQPVLAAAGRQGRQKAVFRKILRLAAFLSFPAMWGIAVIAPEFVPMAMGGQWTPCVPYLQALCIAGAFIPISQNYSNLLIARGHSAAFLKGTAAMMVVQMAVIVWAHCVEAGMLALVMGVGALQVVWVAVWHFTARREIALRAVEALRDIVPFAAGAAMAMAAAYLAAMPIELPIVRMVVKILTAAAVYCAIMHFAHAKIFSESVAFLLQRFKH